MPTRFVIRFRVRIAAPLLVLFAAFAPAQDRVKLEDGTLVRGDILSTEGGVIRMVTEACRLETIAAGDVAKVKRGPDLSPVVKERLKAIHAERAGHLYALARWALTERGLKKDGLRLMRRVVAFRPDHSRAREALGHVNARGTWYLTPRAAYLAVGETMKAEGYVYYRNGWVKKELLSYVKAARKEWVLYQGFLWRSFSEVRKERGDKVWDQQWYTHEEAKLVSIMKGLQERTDDLPHGAQAGRCRVVTVQGREEARELAERQQKARDWFINTFDVKKRQATLVKFPVTLDIVLSGEPAFDLFLEKYKDRYGFSDRYAALSRQCGSASWQGSGHAVHLGTPAWEYSMVSALGHHLMERFFHGGRPPAWISIAAAHHAEIAIFGDARVQWVRLGHYDNDVKVPKLEGRNLTQIKEAVREFYADRPMPGLRVLCSRKMNELTPELDLLGVVYLAFVLEVHREAWIVFLSNPGPARLPDRVVRRFGKTMEEVDQGFREWLKG